MPPPAPDGQTAVDALRHVSQEHLARAIGWLVTGLVSLVITLLGYIGVRESRKVSGLVKWKEKVVEPALKELPEKYVLAKSCDRRHDELIEEIRTSRAEQRGEALHLRGLLERHLGISGGGDGP